MRLVRALLHGVWAICRGGYGRVRSAFTILFAPTGSQVAILLYVTDASGSQQSVHLYPASSAYAYLGPGYYMSAPPLSRGWKSLRTSSVPSWIVAPVPSSPAGSPPAPAGSSPMGVS